MGISIFNLTHAFKAVVNAPVHAVTIEFSDFIAVVFKMFTNINNLSLNSIHIIIMMNLTCLVLQTFYIWKRITE